MAKIEKQVWLVQFDGEQPFVNCYAPTSSGYKTLAGPVTVTFDVPNACPHCGGALPEAQDKAEPPKELVVEAGGKYKTRGGEIAHVVRYEGPEITYPMSGFVNGRGSCWTATGKWYVGKAADDDLVERLS